MSSQLFDVFLCHNSRDKVPVRLLAKLLEGRGIRVWLDEWELAPGTDWLDALEKMIETARTAAVLVGSAGLGPWENREIKALLSEFVKRRLTVIPVLLPGTTDAPRLPLFLQAFVWVDLREGLTDHGLQLLEWGIKGRKQVNLQRQRLLGQDNSVPNFGEAWFDPSMDMRFLWIPGGTLKMGDEKFTTTQPVHSVELSPFWLAETPVTNKQYEKFEMRSADFPKERFRDPSQPAIGVSWNRAIDFCYWYSQRTGLNATLPSEAQWEFASRGSEGRTYPWGFDPPNINRACFDLEGPLAKPAAVGSFPEGRGPFGNEDMLGNVWELCFDIYDREAYAGRAHKPTFNPVVDFGHNPEIRVLRGGCWFTKAEFLVSSYRNWTEASFFHESTGFRVALIP